MIDKILNLVVQFANRNEPDIIFSQGEFIPNPFKRFSKKRFLQLWKESARMNNRR